MVTEWTLTEGQARRATAAQDRGDSRGQRDGGPVRTEKASESTKRRLRGVCCEQRPEPQDDGKCHVKQSVFPFFFFFFKSLLAAAENEIERNDGDRLGVSTWTGVIAVEMERRDSVLEILLKKDQQDLAVDLI